MPEIIAEVDDGVDITAHVAATPGSLTDDYNDLQNHPSINGVELEGDKTTSDLHIDHVPLADNLVASSGITSSSPYLFRKSPQNASAELHRLTGATVAWNQMADRPVGNSSASGITWTKNNDGSFTVSGTASAAATKRTTSYYPANGHVYLFTKTDISSVRLNVYTSSGSTQKLNTDAPYAIIKTDDTWTDVSIFLRVQSGTALGDTGVKIWTMMFDLTQMFGSTMADAIYTMETTTAGSGVAFFRSLFPSAYYPYSASTLKSVQTSARVTRGFNQWDEEWRNGYYSNSTGAYTASSAYFANANPIPVIPGEQYNLRIGDNSTMRFLFYGEDGAYLSYTDKTASDSVFTVPTGAVWMNFCGTTTNYGSVYKHDICINISDTSRNGQYQPYKSKSYPIDDVVLRGIPKLTNGVLSYDGDIYLPSGEVTRRYGVATFDGSETGWGSETVSGVFSLYIHLATVGKMQDRVSGNLNNGQCRANNFLNVSTTQAWQFTVTSAYINFRVDSTITTVAEWKTWLGNHPQTVLYPLATPTTEQADPYAEIQLAGTTEQFVTQNDIPVGNESFYPTDLTGVVQNLAPLPTTAGEYKLKVTVTGGVPSYSWVAG